MFIIFLFIKNGLFFVIGKLSTNHNKSSTKKRIVYPKKKKPKVVDNKTKQVFVLSHLVINP